MLPLTAGYLIAGPISGILSDKYGPRWFTTIGLALGALSFGLFLIIPVNFAYPSFALILLLNGVSSGLFSSPNSAAIMNSVPAESRGVASGMRAAFWNVGSPISTGVFFTLMILGLNAAMPAAMYSGLTQNGISAPVAEGLSKLPPVGYLFAAFLGYNPLGTLLGSNVLGTLPAATSATLTSRSFFPHLIMDPFRHGLTVVLVFSMIVYFVAVIISWFRGRNYVSKD